MVKDSSSGWSSALAGGADTIVARATPAGRGGLAVVRVSGPAAHRMAGAVCPALDPGRGWRAGLVELFSGSGETIDQAVVIPYSAPRSYTGEDMLELMVHGSVFVVGEVVRSFIDAGARAAEPGEFTRRAVANGKLDLVQAEAVNELASAETAWHARQAQEQLAGTLSREFSGIREALVELLTQLEGALDFSHQEIAFDDAEVRSRRDEIVRWLERLLATAVAGKRLRDGVGVVILGAPNAGKSTLFNRLVGSERAIVSPHAGTTRDVVEAELEIAGVRVILQDTAGLGMARDELGQEGVRRARGAAAGADAVLLVWPVDDDEEPAVDLASGQAVLRLQTKWDLAGDCDPPPGWMAVSCRTGGGLGALRRALGELVSEGVEDLGGRIVMADRHRTALQQAVAELVAADFGQPELAAEAVRAALDAVRELLGEVVTEDLLDRVFRTFCLGK